MPVAQGRPSDPRAEMIKDFDRPHQKQVAWGILNHTVHRYK